MVRVEVFQAIVNDAVYATKNTLMPFMNYEHNKDFLTAGKLLPTLAEQYTKVCDLQVRITTMGDMTLLEKLFDISNRGQVKDWTGRSMSVSDIAKITREDEAPKYYYTDSIGFVEVEE